MSDVKVEIYTKDHCPYCGHAKRLLESKGVTYVEHYLEDKPEDFAALMKKTGMRTVPQIFINGELVGGFKELSALDSEGKLDTLLGLA